MLVKMLSTNKYTVRMEKHTDVVGTVYYVDISGYFDIKPIYLVETKDFNYASQLFDTMVESLKTIRSKLWDK